jgi:hypothetical protein
MQYSKSHILLLIAFIFFTACRPTPPNQISRAFYHWKTNFDLSAQEKKYIDTLHIDKLYVRFFDIDFQDGEVLPLAVIEKTADNTHDKQQIIPTIFITNRTFQHIHLAEIPNFAALVVGKMRTLLDKYAFAPPMEIQFDCDWTEQTRDKYFAFLTEFYKKSNIALSATIRLHQIKFSEKTGVPPVQRGMLMFYNMTDIDNPQTKNSILDVSEGANYLSRAATYPLDLDIALPIFRWGVLFREEALIKIITNIEDVKLNDNQFFTQKNKNEYELTQNSYFGGHYLYKGDMVRIETVSPTEIKKAANLLQQSIKSTHRTIALYHLDSAVINRYQYDDLEKIYRIFH